MEIAEAMDTASKGIQAASTELSRLTQLFHEANVDTSGEIKMGTGLAFDIAIKEELAAIYAMAIENDKRPPAEDIRAAMAERAVKTKRPELWSDYYAQKARIDALQVWISSQKAAISANQTLLNSEAVG